VREARIRAIYAEDEGRELRKSHENPDVKALYERIPGRAAGTQVPRALAHQVRGEGPSLVIVRKPAVTEGMPTVRTEVSKAKSALILIVDDDYDFLEITVSSSSGRATA